MDKIQINKISEINKDKLIKFYQRSFNFEKSVLENFEWRYRLGLDNLEPLILIVNNEICGHAGLMPVDLKINNEVKRFIWFTDFYIIPELRNKGYGKLLTERWMKICPNQITLCNNKSLEIFKKFDWLHNNDFIRKIKILNYYKIFPIFRKKIQSKILVDKLGDIKLKEPTITTIKKIVSIEEKMLQKKNVGIIRDEKWFRWRILDCPYLKNIYIFENKNDYFITNIKIKNNLSILNIIYSTKIIDNECLGLFSEFVKRNQIDLISYVLKKDKMFSLNLPWKKQVNFAFFSNDKSIINALKNGLDDIKFIDSDIDYI